MQYVNVPVLVALAVVYLGIGLLISAGAIRSEWPVIRFSILREKAGEPLDGLDRTIICFAVVYLAATITFGWGAMFLKVVSRDIFPDR